MISNIICEHPLPLKEISEEEKKDLEGVKWDEHVFYTSSFFDADSEFKRTNFIISEDGLFYKHCFELELSHDPKGHLVSKEVDIGLEQDDFTGKILFGTEVFGEDYDYAISFEAIFYKGELKELNLDIWDKVDNSERKSAAKKAHILVMKEAKKRRRVSYLFVSALKFVVKSLVEIPKWVLLHLFGVIIKLEIWCKK